ncbi:hypothetical protein [Bdellovibrio sp. HCB274]|uniref:hypothetical protein n=1 Tax=Bdellovibrio sp. HCB274 TaxID=3394361 RepID=UPI0039B657F4
MGCIKETFEDYKYAADDAEELETPPSEFMDYLPAFPEDLKRGTLSLGAGGVTLSFFTQAWSKRSSGSQQEN